MSMSKKDYVAIAAIVRTSYNQARGPQASVLRLPCIEVIDNMVDSMVDLMGRGDSNFQPRLFLDACTPRWHKVNRGLKVEDKGNVVRRPVRAAR